MTAAIPSRQEFNRIVHADKVPILSVKTLELFKELGSPQDISWGEEMSRLQLIVAKKGLSARDVISPLFRSLFCVSLIASAILMMIYLPPTLGTIPFFAGPGFQVFINTTLFTPAIAFGNLGMCYFLDGPIKPLKELKGKIHETRPEVVQRDIKLLLQKINDSSAKFNQDYPFLKQRLLELNESKCLADLEKLKKYYDLMG